MVIYKLTSANSFHYRHRRRQFELLVSSVLSIYVGKTYWCWYSVDMMTCHMSVNLTRRCI